MQTIPYIDIRNASPSSLLEQHPEKARRLIQASRNAFGLASRLASHVALPLGDHWSRAWLEKTQNPYRDEIHHYARTLGTRGVYALNLCYEWGCTSGAYAKDEGMTLMRVLDWPFPELGEHLVVAHQSGTAGDFYNLTWPGVAGVYSAMAPQRFSAALNQAPMRQHRRGYALDWVANRRLMMREAGLPPAHLLRFAFETARSYEEAKTLLCNHPVAIPVIYILAGTKPGEGCVIERLENDYAVRELTNGNACASNHFLTHLNGEGRGWLPREIDSRGRFEAACALNPSSIDGAYAWFQYPIANVYSRVALVTDAAKGTLYLMGTDAEKPVTEMFSLPRKGVRDAATHTA